MITLTDATLRRQIDIGRRVFIIQNRTLEAAIFRDRSVTVPAHRSHSFFFFYTMKDHLGT